MNSLLSSNESPHFEDFEAAEVVPAIELLIARCEAALLEVTSARTTASHQQLAQILDVPLEALNEGWGTVMHLLAVLDSPELREAVKLAQPLVTAFYSKLSSNEQLHECYKAIARLEGDRLTGPQRQALANSLRGFRLAGAELDDGAKVRFIEAQQRLSSLSREFSLHVLDATDHFIYWATAQELDGVPADVMRRLAAAAAADGRQDAFKITLQQPCLGPVLQFAHCRELRERLYKANATRASEFGPAEQDNGPVIAEIMRLRQERAVLLGLGTAADVSLVPKMASSPLDVTDFLRDMGRRARHHALDERAELAAFAQSNLGLDDMEAWDVAYATEALRHKRYAYSEEDVKEHFRLDRVLGGIFDIAWQLFGVRFHAEHVSAWHATVSGYRVEREGVVLGRFFLDAFARTGKRAGAWMNGARPRWRRPDGSLRTAMAYLVTNFAAPAQGQPALLRHGEVVTLFHELGHALHFLLSEIDVLGVSGVSGVEWDAVELPSQLFENFAWQWPVLEHMTMNPQTGQGLPRDLFDKMTAARRFQSGLWLLRQVEFALFDMRLHAEPDRAQDAQAVIDEVRSEVAVLLPPSFNRFQNAFSHVFAGSYAAGYYSYLWAEVLASDAWDAFEQAGVTDAATGQRYLDAILSKGGSRSMRESFEAFRGRQPTIDALLRQRGLGSPRPHATGEHPCAEAS